MTERFVVAAAVLALVSCAPLDDCEDRLASNRPIPAEGCCTNEGFCVWPPEYSLECYDFSRSECDAATYPPVYEGGPEWTFCPPLPDAPCFPPPGTPMVCDASGCHYDTSHGCEQPKTACPLSALEVP
jgi:hypothetical protein